ncbi:MAG: hypothetical protein OEZ32_13030 [Nitrospinota bacterium]|nr:hypothetical protein [Nitrospinota bacterium]
MKKSGLLGVMVVAMAFASSLYFFSPEYASGLTGFGGIDTHMHLFSVSGKRRDMTPNRGASGSFQRPGGQKRDLGESRRPPSLLRGPDSPVEEEYKNAARTLLKLMDKRNVAKAMVMPPPQYPGQPGVYDYKTLLPAIQAGGGRLILVAGGGSLNPLIMGTKADKVTQMDTDNFNMEAMQIVKAGAVAFGEMTALHVCKNEGHHYMAAPPDHPHFLQLADIAASHGMPIDLHMEAVPEEMATPQRLLEACSKNPRVLPPTIPGLERLLKHNRNAMIVWQHIGWDNTGQMTTQLLNRLLYAHPNLFLSIRILSWQQTRREGHFRNAITDPRGRIRPEWAELFSDHPGRFMVGGDGFVGENGFNNESSESFNESWRAINNLLEPARSKVSWKTAEHVYKVHK